MSIQEVKWSWLRKKEKSVPPTRSSQSDTTDQRTEVYYGTENVLNAELRFFVSSKQKIDSCMNNTHPELAIEIEQIKTLYEED